MSGYNFLIELLLLLFVIDINKYAYGLNCVSPYGRIDNDLRVFIFNLERVIRWTNIRPCGITLDTIHLETGRRI